MTDRELLELAAKAAGIDIKPMEINNRLIAFMAPPKQCPRGLFNPLEDDGDALRLAVGCSIDIELTVDQAEAWYVYPMPGLDNDQVRSIVKAFGADPNAATRRAIVGAAAEIGNAMK